MQLVGIYLSIAFTALIQGGVSLFAVYLSTRGYSISETVLPLSLMGVGGLIGSFIGGVLTDHISPRFLGIVLAAMWLIMPFGFSAESYLYVCVNMLLVGISLASLRAIYLAVIICQFSSEDVEMHLSHRRLLLNLGVAGGSALVGYLLRYEYTMFSYYFLFIGCLTLAATAFLPDAPVEKKDVVIATTNKETSKTNYSLILMALFLTLLPFSLIPNIYSLYLKEEIGFSEVILGNMFAISGVLIAVLQVPMTKLLKGINGKVKSIIGMVLIGVGVGGVQLVNAEWHLYLSTTVWTIGEIILFVPILKELLHVTPMANGKTVASYQLTFSFSEIVAPLLGGALILVSYQMLWNLVLGLTFISIGIITYLYFKERKNNEYSINQYSA